MDVEGWHPSAVGDGDPVRIVHLPVLVTVECCGGWYGGGSATLGVVVVVVVLFKPPPPVAAHAGGDGEGFTILLLVTCHKCSGGDDEGGGVELVGVVGVIKHFKGVGGVWGWEMKEGDGVGVDGGHGEVRAGGFMGIGACAGEEALGGSFCGPQVAYHLEKGRGREEGVNNFVDMKFLNITSSNCCCNGGGLRCVCAI